MLYQLSYVRAGRIVPPVYESVMTTGVPAASLAKPR